MRIALAYKGIAYEPRFVSVPKMEHHAADYLAKNPQGLVPALVDDAGRVFTQSMAMIEYLDDIHPEPPLMPRGAEDKWYVRAVSQIIGCEMHPLTSAAPASNIRMTVGYGAKSQLNRCALNSRPYVLRYLSTRTLLNDAKVNGDWYPHWVISEHLNRNPSPGAGFGAVLCRYRYITERV